MHVYLKKIGALNMNLEVVLDKLSKHQRNVQSAIKLLREISRLDKNRMENLPKLRTRLVKLEEFLINLDKNQDYVLNLKDWINQYKSVLKDTANQIQRKLGIELEEQMKNLGLSLSGQYPELKAGFFTIELDFDNQKATLWYGPKQERLSQCPLTATAIAKQIEKAKKELGSKLNEQELLEKVRSAYYRVVEMKGVKKGEPVPIIEVLAELAYLLQSQRFRQDPRRENYRSYSRADFSYDLFRVRSHQINSLFPSKLHLKTATRAHTRRRSDFLWVPDDESGKGTTYSHLAFKEVEK